MPLLANDLPCLSEGVAIFRQRRTETSSWVIDVSHLSNGITTLK